MLVCHAKLPTPLQRAYIRNGAAFICKDRDIVMHTFNTPDYGEFTPDTSVCVVAPDHQRIPVVFASPHSGRDYPAGFLSQSCLDPVALRRSEDAYVDELFSDVTELGAPLIHARFPRVYVDVNREAMELDPAMFEDDLPHDANIRSPRVGAGIGTIAKVVSSGQNIYAGPIHYADDGCHRIESCYRPYHSALRKLIDQTLAQFGTCLLVDCHSMPSLHSGAVGHRADIVLGDCWGRSCHQNISDTAERAASIAGYSVRRNLPYAGGFTTRHYGQPTSGVHALQIEIDRGLYMDERSITRLPVFNDVRAGLMRIATALSDMALSDMGIMRMAAE